MTPPWLAWTGPTGPTGPYWSDIRGAEASHHGSWIKNHGSWIMDQGSRIQDQRIQDLGPCFGVNRHSRRDTDVISRLSKSTIQDLSLYIGFTRIGPWTLYLGPCFGMNGHFRRDPDLISRPSTIYDPRSIILYRFYKDRIKYPGSWTLFWHEWRF